MGIYCEAWPACNASGGFAKDQFTLDFAAPTRASPLSVCIVRLNVRPDAADDAGLGDDRLEDHLGQSRFTQGRLPELR
jgi:hypothetical protein